MTSVRVDVTVITSAMMSASDPVARGARERAWFNPHRNFCWHVRARGASDEDDSFLVM